MKTAIIDLKSYKITISDPAETNARKVGKIDTKTLAEFEAAKKAIESQPTVYICKYKR